MQTILLLTVYAILEEEKQLYVLLAKEMPMVKQWCDDTQMAMHKSKQKLAWKSFCTPDIIDREQNYRSAVECHAGTN